MMRCKADIEYHQLGYGYKVVPAVNVKVYGSLTSGYNKWKKDNPDADKRFTLEWIEEQIPDDDDTFWFCCERGWEELQEEAERIYGGYGIKVYSEGRSGGWAYIDGMNTDVDTWDAIEFTQWRSFSNFAKRGKEWIMYNVVDVIYYNQFEAWRDEESELAAPAIPEGMVA